MLEDAGDGWMTAHMQENDIIAAIPARMTAYMQETDVLATAHLKQAYARKHNLLQSQVDEEIDI